MSEEFIKVVNFDGFISHVSDSGEGSEVIIYVAHVVSDDSRIQGGNDVRGSQDPCGGRINNNGSDYGSAFTIRVGKCMERVVEKDFLENERLAKVHLIDKGIDVEVERSALFPSASKAKINDDCMCPVLVVGAGEEQREVAAQITGHECRCIDGNLVVIPSVGLCVKGRLLISYGNDGYAELKDISLVPAEGSSKLALEDVPQPNMDISSPSADARPFHYRYNSLAYCKKFCGNDGERYEQKECSGVVDIYRREAYTFTESHFTKQGKNDRFQENSAVTENSVPLNPSNDNGSSRDTRLDHGFAKYVEMSLAVIISNCVLYSEEMDETCVLMSRPNACYKQFFKDYAPHVYPRTVRIRFDKTDSLAAGTFWAFEPSIFTTVERILHEGRQRYSTCPLFDPSLVHELSGMGCLVRASVDNGHRSLCRAEIIKFSNSTYRHVFGIYFISFSVYLVDYGFYKWINCYEVFDISVINKVDCFFLLFEAKLYQTSLLERDKILHLPVALLHCRLEEFRNGIRLQHLEKGGEYEITINSRDSEGILNVHFNRINNKRSALTNIPGSLVPFNRNRNSMFPYLTKPIYKSALRAAKSNLPASQCSYSSLQFANNELASAFQRNMSISEAACGNSLMSTMMANKIGKSQKPGMCGFGMPYPMMMPMPIMMPTMPNFGNVTIRGQEQICTQHEQHDNTGNRNSFSSRIPYRVWRRSNNRSMSHTECKYRTFERSGEPNNSDNFDEYSDSQTQHAYGSRYNGYWGRRGGRYGGYRGRRPGRYSYEARRHDSFDGPESSSFNRYIYVIIARHSVHLQENNRDESIACTENSERDLPQSRQRHDISIKSTTGTESELNISSAIFLIRREMFRRYDIRI
uniref:Tudor domain-containing protein n=1 Tax=Elaeophora elaphi TaxID=1147741 RepID=A0A0R3RRS8_9BILA